VDTGTATLKVVAVLAEADSLAHLFCLHEIDLMQKGVAALVLVVACYWLVCS
jgi:hypothetical protein